MKTRVILVGPVIETRHLPRMKELLSSLKITSKDRWVGVDEGTALIKKLGYVPGFAIGDWDSLKDSKILSQIPHQTLAREKDVSDLGAALQLVQHWGVQEVIALGFLGGRPDHHLASLFELSHSGVPRVGAWVFEGGWKTRFEFLSAPSRRELKLSLPVGQTISIFSLNGRARGVSLTGLKHRLTRSDLEPSSHGLSNETIYKTCKITVESGNLCVVIPYES